MLEMELHLRIGVVAGLRRDVEKTYRVRASNTVSRTYLEAARPPDSLLIAGLEHGVRLHAVAEFRRCVRSRLGMHDACPAEPASGFD